MQRGHALSSCTSTLGVNPASTVLSRTKVVELSKCAYCIIIMRAKCCLVDDLHFNLPGSGSTGSFPPKRHDGQRPNRSQCTMTDDVRPVVESKPHPDVLGVGRQHGEHTLPPTMRLIKGLSGALQSWVTAQCLVGNLDELRASFPVNE